jgi:hypothetical protein
MVANHQGCWHLRELNPGGGIARFGGITLVSVKWAAR